MAYSEGKGLSGTIRQNSRATERCHHFVRIDTSHGTGDTPIRRFKDSIDVEGRVLLRPFFKYHPTTIPCDFLKQTTRSKRGRNVGCRESECSQDSAVEMSILKLSVSRDDSVAERRLSTVTVAMAEQASTTRRGIGELRGFFPRPRFPRYFFSTAPQRASGVNAVCQLYR